VPNKKKELTDEERRKREQANRDSFLETIEAFVVAFVLAFVFRAYVVEAFVIPTGSMAPRLNGEHLELECRNCGYWYNVGLDRQQGAPPAPGAVQTICPLCFSRKARGDTFEPFSGDRILVLKYFYDFFPPQRWDVFVFKYPHDPKQNYIKRLIGLPGEAVEVRGGDVYINGTIARKPDRAQDALWMPVADTDYWDRKDGPRWRPQSGDDGRWQWSSMPLKFTPEGDRMSYIAYHHVDLRGLEASISDFYAYDDPVEKPGRQVVRQDDRNTVADLRLLVDVELSGPGLVELAIGAYDDDFQFLLPVEGARRRLEIRHNGKAIDLPQAPVDPLPRGKKVLLEAANVDHKLMLKVNGERIMDLNADGRLDESDRSLDDISPRSYSDPKRFSGQPYEETRLKLGISGTEATIHRLRVSRDIYYTNDKRETPGKPLAGRTFGTGTEKDQCILGQDQFFALGDNSPNSADSRRWDNPVVPRENIAGKAFFVYWPAAGLRYGVPVARVLPDVTKFRLIR